MDAYVCARLLPRVCMCVCLCVSVTVVGHSVLFVSETWMCISVLLLLDSISYGMNMLAKQALISQFCCCCFLSFGMSVKCVSLSHGGCFPFFFLILFVCGRWLCCDCW